MSRFFRQIAALAWMAMALACTEPEVQHIHFASPAPGDNFNVGDRVKVGLDIPGGTTISSVRYLLDGKPIATGSKEAPFMLPTANLPLGYRLLTAIVQRDASIDTINTNIVLKTNRAPIKLKYRLVASYPHDTSAYTEGLSFVDGKLLESTGINGASSLKYVDLKSGSALQRTTIPSQYFGEGSVKVGNKIVMLTWREDIGFIFDARTLKRTGTFPYQTSREGWGLTFDGTRILRSDGTNRIWFMDPRTYREQGFLEVYDHKGQVINLNELEYIDGKIYANVYTSTKIVRINPNSGEVDAELDLAPLVPKNYFKTDNEVQNNVLNGIAYDEETKRLFVVGKKWPKLYEIKLIP